MVCCYYRMMMRNMIRYFEEEVINRLFGLLIIKIKINHLVNKKNIYNKKMIIDEWFTDYMDLLQADFMNNTIEAGFDKDLADLSFELFREYSMDYTVLLLEVLRLFQEVHMLKEKMDERLIASIGVEYPKDLCKLLFEMVREYSNDIVKMFKPTLSNEEFCLLALNLRNVLVNRIRNILLEKKRYKNK